MPLLFVNSGPVVCSCGRAEGLDKQLIFWFCRGNHYSMINENGQVHFVSRTVQKVDSHFSGSDNSVTTDNPFCFGLVFLNVDV